MVTITEHLLITFTDIVERSPKNKHIPVFQNVVLGRYSICLDTSEFADKVLKTFSLQTCQVPDPAGLFGHTKEPGKEEFRVVVLNLLAHSFWLHLLFFVTTTLRCLCECVCVCLVGWVGDFSLCGALFLLRASRALLFVQSCDKLEQSCLHTHTDTHRPTSTAIHTLTSPYFRHAGKSCLLCVCPWNPQPSQTLSKPKPSQGLLQTQYFNHPPPHTHTNTHKKHTHTHTQPHPHTHTST